MARISVPLDPRLVIDTVAKTAVLHLCVPAAAGEGDVVAFSQDVTSRLTADDRRRLRHLLDGTDSTAPTSP